MCFTASKDKNLNKINKSAEKDLKKIRNEEKFKPSFKLSAFAHDYLPVIKEEDTLDFMSWGLVQPTARDNAELAEVKFMTANAKCETIFEKKWYMDAIFERRCLIVVDGFYEWRHQFNKKYPHYIHHATAEVLFIGGIWSQWTNPLTGEQKETVSMITTTANPMMEYIHNNKKRMPLIFDTTTAFQWLKPDWNKAQLTEMMQPYPEEKMKAYTIGRNLEPDSPGTLVPVHYPELSNIQQSLF
jgi:putative SOS response-associated peptidase YedK